MKNTQNIICDPLISLNKALVGLKKVRSSLDHILDKSKDMVNISKVIDSLDFCKNGEVRIFTNMPYTNIKSIRTRTFATTLSHAYGVNKKIFTDCEKALKEIMNNG